MGSVSLGRNRAFQLRQLLSGIARLSWAAVRASAYMLLVILEPLVRVALIGLALVAATVALVFEFSGAAPRFPFLGMIGFAAGCLTLLVAYYATLRLVTR